MLNLYNFNMEFFCHCVLILLLILLHVLGMYGGRWTFPFDPENIVTVIAKGHCQGQRTWQLYVYPSLIPFGSIMIMTITHSPNHQI